MAPALAKVGGALLQAEDELASVNMIIGASYGGVPSLTATSGPGLALMTEAIGLAVAAEVPIVVVDVMRGGPSTGIPAKSEQSDLSFAVSRPARRRAAAGAGADLDRRLRGDDAMGRATRRGAAGAGDRAVGPVHGPVARDHRPAGRRRLCRRAPDGRREHARLQALSRHVVGRLADGDPRHARHRLHGRRARALRGGHSEQPGARPSACNSTSASASWRSTTTAAGGPTSRARATPR